MYHSGASLFLSTENLICTYIICRICTEYTDEAAVLLSGVIEPVSSILLGFPASHEIVLSYLNEDSSYTHDWIFQEKIEFLLAYFETVPAATEWAFVIV